MNANDIAKAALAVKEAEDWVRASVSDEDRYRRLLSEQETRTPIMRAKLSEAKKRLDCILVAAASNIKTDAE
jgi:hypothetical protein